MRVIASLSPMITPEISLTSNLLVGRIQECWKKFQACIEKGEKKIRNYVRDYILFTGDYLKT